MQNRRSELRIPKNAPAFVTVLGDGPSMWILGRLVESSSTGMRLSITQYLDPGTLVKIELADTLVLAEVCHCQSTGSDFLVGLKVDQVLSGLRDLMRLNDRLMPPLRENQEAASRR